jgi:hypothetical protein
MMKTLTRSPTPLRDILYELSLTKELPDAELLDEFIRRYPDYASALTEFAIELVVERLGREEPAEAVNRSKAASAAVSRAMSRYQNMLHSNRAAKAASVAQSATRTSSVVSPFTALDRRSFRQLAHDMSANTLFLCKVRDRQIDPKTLTSGFIRLLADKLKCLVEVISTYLAAGPLPVLHNQFCKAEEKPVTGLRQTFQEAVRSSGLTEEQQCYLLSL